MIAVVVRKTKISQYWRGFAEMILIVLCMSWDGDTELDLAVFISMFVFALLHPPFTLLSPVDTEFDALSMVTLIVARSIIFVLFVGLGACIVLLHHGRVQPISQSLATTDSLC
ncbi:hypothetical protein BDV23DRAFT_143847 [Aspergillus alliaceus]|uniref:Uncharacterized protein n=1 Tax=Petromyces alliaceus TaxID=209559 RepID=A0A5N7CQ37_PETAA|nr:uncharacterized protein BDW43DRAFT_268717 [Aspergillus alliaceus]KAB8235965.1 hypothetical protein BDW43DRAFT_268717 [Aspergillus alliaceus]KAE8396326.1 hypothetical protein BDV23DRAFT_143847 [Aspergillus alliaceus]